jgi:hypothetical protein
MEDSIKISFYSVSNANMFGSSPSFKLFLPEQLISTQNLVPLTDEVFNQLNNNIASECWFNNINDILIPKIPCMLAIEFKNQNISFFIDQNVKTESKKAGNNAFIMKETNKDSFGFGVRVYCDKGKLYISRIDILKLL